MVIKKDFERHSLEEEYTKADIVNVRLNHQERLMLDALKLSHKEKNDSTMLKKASFRFIKEVMNYDKLLRK